MLSTMQDSHPLTVQTLFEHGASIFADSEVVTFDGVKSRRITFALTHVDHAVHTLDGTRHRHGLLNVLAATACALSGGSTDDVADLLATADLETARRVIESITARRLRDAFSGVATTDPAALMGELTAIGVLGPEA